MLLYIDRTLADMSLVNLDLWNLFIAIVSLCLTYQVRIMTWRQSHRPSGS